MLFRGELQGVAVQDVGLYGFLQLGDFGLQLGGEGFVGGCL